MIGKTEVFILFISFLHLVSSFPHALGDNFKCKSRNGKFPKQGSFCRSYYECTNWNPKEKACPQDQHFFPSKGYCVWSEEYPCLEKPQSKECPLPDGKFLKPGADCKVYYDCCKGRPTEKKCPKDTLFDHARGKCDWPEYVTCPEKPKSKKCPRLYGKFLKPGTGCKKFYECRDGIPTERKCPSDQLFDPDREICEWLDIYTCNEESKSKKCPRLYGKFLKPGTGCKKFYECHGGIATQRKCPSGQLFDPNREICEWLDIYTCVEDVSSTKSTSHSTSTLSITSTHVSKSTKGEVTTSTISPKIVTDSDEDSSSEENSSEEENNSEENRQSSTKFETISTSIVSSTISNEYTESTEGVSSTQSPSTVESSSRVVSNTTAPDDISTISEISSASFTDEHVKKTTTYPEVVTEETHTEIVTIGTHPEVVTEDTHTEVVTTGIHTEVVTKETHPEVVTEETHTEIVTGTHPEDVTKETHTEVVTKETHPEVVTEETHTEIVTTGTHPEVSTEETHSEVVTKETHPEIVTKETHTEIVTGTHPEVVTKETYTEATYTIEGKDGYSKTVTSGLTDSVTTHIFCPKPNGYFPHPYDKHKFVACIGGDPTIMNCPGDLIYDHKRRSCEYNIKKRKINKMTKYL